MNDIGYHANGFVDLVFMIEEAMNNGIDDGVSEFMEGILPGRLRGCSGKVIAKFLIGLDS